jgi:hypothetical protein
VQIKNRQQLLTILTLSAVALLALDKIVWPPLQGIWDRRAQRIRTLKENVNGGNSMKLSRSAITSQWNKIQTGALSNNTSVAEQQLFTGFDRWAQMSGVIINSETPNWKQNNEGDYKTLECRVDAKGNVATLSQFLYQIEKDPMDVKLQSVELTASDPAGEQLALGLQVSGLVLLTPKEQKK